MIHTSRLLLVSLLCCVVISPASPRDSGPPYLIRDRYNPATCHFSLITNLIRKTGITLPCQVTARSWKDSRVDLPQYLL
ncbi:hypothetical protein F5B21DRAFT_478039 [Xylaria acuta]|nr:hypothetical protein F5B21DRAFT_478039 [Xylaria acuta]